MCCFSLHTRPHALSVRPGGQRSTLLKSPCDLCCLREAYIAMAPELRVWGGWSVAVMTQATRAARSIAARRRRALRCGAVTLGPRRALQTEDDDATEFDD